MPLYTSNFETWTYTVKKNLGIYNKRGVQHVLCHQKECGFVPKDRKINTKGKLLGNTQVCFSGKKNQIDKFDIQLTKEMRSPQVEHW